MYGSRKVLYITTGINFLFGIIIGIVLFYGQLQADVSVFEDVKVYDSSVSFADFLKVSGSNFLWLAGIFVCGNILPLIFVHPVIILRACCSSFSLMYILNFVGIKAAAVAVLPQCFSILPAMILFTALVEEKRKNGAGREEGSISFKRKDFVITLLSALLSAGAETSLFAVLALCLL